MTDILTDSSFYLPNTTTSVLSKGTGVATSSRTTVKYVLNSEGYWTAVRSGGHTRGGARIVQNWCSSKSEDFTHASWVKGGSVTATDANTIQCANATSAQYIQDSSVANQVFIGQQWIATFRVSYIDIRYVQIMGPNATFGPSQYCNFDLIEGDFTATGCTAYMTAAGTGTWDISVQFTATADAASGVFSLALVNSQTATLLQAFTGDGDKSVGVLRFMVENVTGNTIKTPSEYVSVGVLSSPFHGSGADGVKYFDTMKTGGAIPTDTLLGTHLDPVGKTNLMLHCRDLSQGAWRPSTVGSALYTSDGTSAAEWASLGAGANATIVATGGELQVTSVEAGGGVTTPFTTVIGKTYVAYGNAKRLSGTGGAYISALSGATAVNGVSQVTSTYAKVQVTFVAAATTTNLRLRCTGATSTCCFDDLAIAEAGVRSSLGPAGITGLSGAASLVTADVAGATILQEIITASVPACTGFFVRRSAGSGAVYMTRDGGTNWLAINNQLNTSTFYVAKIEGTSVLNPLIGFKFDVAGDAIIVDAGLNHAGTSLCEPIFTTAAAVTRNADILTYPTSGNFSDAAGTIVANFFPTYPAGLWPAGSVVGKAGFGLLTAPGTGGVNGADGTNVVTGLAGIPNTKTRIGIRWSGSSLEAFAGDNILSVGEAGAYDGSFNLSSIGLCTESVGYIRDIAIFPTSLSESEISQVLGMTAFSFAPAFSSLPLYHGGLIIVTPIDPIEVDPEPTPVFATDFTGLTVSAPLAFVSNVQAAWTFTGTDSATGFVLPPTYAPLYTITGSGGFGAASGVHINTGSTFPFSANTVAGVNARANMAVVPMTVRGVATNAVQLGFDAPGGYSNFDQQIWFQLYRNTGAGFPDLKEHTTRLEYLLPSNLDTVIPAPNSGQANGSANGRMVIFDYKAAGDYRYKVELVRSGVSTYFWEVVGDSIANGPVTQEIFFTIPGNVIVPKTESFTLEVYFKRGNNYNDLTTGRLRVRIRPASAAVDGWTTIADVTATTIAQYNAANGTAFRNIHMGKGSNGDGTFGNRIQRMFHGNYPRKLNFDCTLQIAKLRMFNTIL